MTKIVGTKISASTKKTILVVDDDFDIAKVVKLWLQKKGFAAYEFTDPMLALKYFSNNEKNIDLILCDIRMPQMNGYEFVTKIKAIQPKIKVILMSAFEIRQEELSKVLPSIKIDGLVSKPIAMKHLVESIKTHI
jgi:CheY-like chemotaxis protein